MSEAATATSSEAKTDDAAALPKSGGEIRLSFGYFYVLLKWGKERRSNGRIDDERRLYPVLTASNVPVLATAWAAVFMLSYFGLKALLSALVFAAS